MGKLNIHHSVHYTLWGKRKIVGKLKCPNLYQLASRQTDHVVIIP